MSPDLILVRCVYGDKHRVRRDMLEAGRVLLTRYKANGEPMGTTNRRARTFTFATPLHRDNIVNQENNA